MWITVDNHLWISYLLCRTGFGVAALSVCRYVPGRAGAVLREVISSQVG